MKRKVQVRNSSKVRDHDRHINVKNASQGDKPPKFEMKNEKPTTSKNNSNQVLGKYPRTFMKDGKTYKLGLITQKFVFYYEKETQEEAIMYDRDMNLISDNYFAQEGFTEELLKLYKTKGWVWIDSVARYGAKALYEEYGDEENY